MTEKHDPLGAERRYGKALARLTELENGNGKLIREYLDSKDVETISKVKGALALHKLAMILNKPLNQFDPKPGKNKDVQAIRNHYREKGLNPTIAWAELCTFLRWENKKKYADLLESGELKPPRKKAGHRLDPASLPTIEEIQQFNRGITNPYFYPLAMMYEGAGCRTSEPLYCRVRHWNPDGRIEFPAGKTGMRVTRIAPVYAEAINDYLNGHHPEPENPDAFLFLNNRRKPWNENAVSGQYWQVNNRAGLKRDRWISPQKHRRRRATYLLSNLPPALVEKNMGWCPGSQVIRHYSAVSDTAALDAVAALDSQGKYESTPMIYNEPKSCPRCKAVLPSRSVVCKSCSYPVSLPAAIRHEEEQKQQLDRMQEQMAEMRDMMEILADARVHDPVQRRKLILEAVQWKKGKG